MTDQQSEAHKENRLPRGIYALALLMFLAGGALGLAALVLGQNALVQVLLLVGVAIYLLRPGVRTAFLRPAG